MKNFFSDTTNDVNVVKWYYSLFSDSWWVALRCVIFAVLNYRSKDLNKGLSFPSISGSGANGAIIHYKATEETKRAITTKDMYLLDSGGQYL